MDRGLVEMNAAECKGCGLCVEACPPKCLRLADGLNHYGYHPAEYTGSGCTGCGICFYACPEPGAIRVLRRKARRTCHSMRVHGSYRGTASAVPFGAYEAKALATARAVSSG